MLCAKCQKEIPEGEVFEYAGKKFCEDCYVDALTRPKTCDPGAVMAAKTSRELQSQKGTEGLTPLQQKIYNFIKEKGKATPEEVAAHVGISREELDRQFAVLRHCELARGCKEGDKVFLTLM
ncbi:MAG TPA: hypothetical protein DCE07_04420 [Peptococcaceae bacterium]|nr:hypothetical protein [Peptococcaceae bacterium]